MQQAEGKRVILNKTRGVKSSSCHHQIYPRYGPLSLNTHTLTPLLHLANRPPTAVSRQRPLKMTRT